MTSRKKDHALPESEIHRQELLDACYRAIEEDDFETVATMVESGVIDPHRDRGITGFGFIAKAVIYDRERILRFFLRHGEKTGAVRPDSPSHSPQSFYPTSSYAINEALLKIASGDFPESPWRRLKMAALLLRYGADINARDVDRKTPLIRSICYSKDRTLFRFFLRKGADIHLRDHWGRQAIHYCFTKMDWLDDLIEYGADINATDENGDTLLHILCQAACEPSKIAKAIAFGANVNARSHNDETPIMDAAASSCASVPTIELLIAHGADICLVDRFGNNLMHHVAVGHFTNVEYLLRHHLPIDMPNLNDELPIHKAAHRHSIRSIRLLLNAGSPIDAIDNQGRSVLHRALTLVYPYGIETATFLLQNGADQYHTDRQGRSPLGMLFAQNYFKEIFLLAEKGFDLRVTDCDNIPLIEKLRAKVPAMVKEWEKTGRCPQC